MGKIETAVKAEIVRLSRKVSRSFVVKAGEDLRRFRQRLAKLEAQLGELQGAWERQQSKSRMIEVTRSLDKDQTGKVQIRISGGLIRKLRARLGITQAKLSALLGVTPAAVAIWEMGRSRPRQALRAQLAALRKLGRRDVRRILAEKAGAEPARKRAPKVKARKRSGKAS